MNSQAQLAAPTARTQATVCSPALDVSLITKILPFILDRFADELTLDDLADACGMTRFNFCRRFGAEHGVPPMRWLWNFRTVLAGEFITLDPQWSLTDIAFACGFTSSAHFSRSFKAMFSVSPSAFRRDVLTKAVGRHSSHRAEIFSNNHAIVSRAVMSSLGSAAAVS